MDEASAERRCRGVSGTEDEDALFLSVVTLAELRRGVDRLVGGRRRSRMDDWLRSDLAARFAGRLLGIDAATADAWGRLIARRERDGRPMGVMDGWIAATAEVHGLTLVTRDAADFAGTLERMSVDGGLTRRVSRSTSVRSADRQAAPTGELAVLLARA